MRILRYFVFLFLIASASAFAQQFKFKTTSLTVLERGGKFNEWGKWSEPLETQLFVTLDFDKNRIVVYSREIQHYKIIESLPKEVTEVDEINSFLCKNQFGEQAKLSFIVRKNEKNKTQLYIYFTDIIFCYDIIEETN
ncbi:hypothetical protein [Flavobacterium okayamense]|uniref:Beta-lactamase-inhibitor-like, PepSY-like n=1 Tax=Flavobacterium okayamense TaxID=2830782 RepID=A0ABN6I4Y4_9FLAO|nr:hypothetical protein [Flavobacterium okayamense]BCY29543.1 hypothetical protein KK2020170_24110 [Flavobacterium okayamense]